MNLKTKKILLLISTILSLLISIAYIYGIHSGIINLEIAEGTTQITNNTQLAILYICALANFIAIFFISKDLIVHKKKLIALNIIQFLLGTVFNIISAIINIFILSSKTKDIVEEIKEKKKLPILEDITKHKWYVYFIIFVFLFILCYTPIINLLPIVNTRVGTIISLILLYAIQIILLVIPMASELKRDFKVFKNNSKLYLAEMFPRFEIIILVYFICTLLLMLFIGNIPTNQAILVSLPIYITAFLAIVIAPLIEELMFRGFIKKFIKNDILFVILSSLVFGGLHVVGADSLEQILFIIPYSILGFAFSLNYVKTKNIVSNIYLHTVWNLISTIAIILFKLL